MEHYPERCPLLQMRLLVLLSVFPLPGAALSQRGRSAPPESGQLLSRVRTNLAAEHKNISSISQDLLTINADVERTESELLGRVLDEDSAKQLGATHQELNAANDKAREELKKLTSHIHDLKAEIARQQRAYVLEGKTQDEEMLKAKANLTIEASDVQRLSLKAEEVPILKRHYANLEAQQVKLAGDRAHSMQRGADLTRELEETKLALQDEISKEQRLRKALLEVHQYGVNCHERAEQLQKAVHVLSQEVPKQSVAEAAAIKHAEASSKATLQRLQAEAVLLKAEITRTEGSATSAMQSLAFARQNLTILEQDMIAEVHNISYKMNYTKGRIALVQEAIQENLAKQDDDLGRKRGIDNIIESLKRRTNSVVHAALTAENEALEMELTSAMNVLESSKATEAKTFSLAAQKAAEVEAERKVVDAAANQTKLAAIEGQKQLEEAVKEAKEGKERAEEQLAKALEVLATRCTPDWDALNITKTKELEECRKLEEDLAVVKAQRDILRQTLQAQQTAKEAEHAGEKPEEPLASLS